jgi:hypothetical protein
MPGSFSLDGRELFEKRFLLRESLLFRVSLHNSCVCDGDLERLPRRAGRQAGGHVCRGHTCRGRFCGVGIVRALEVSLGRSLRFCRAPCFGGRLLGRGPAREPGGGVSVQPRVGGLRRAFQVPFGDGPSGKTGLEALFPGGVEAGAGLLSEWIGRVLAHESEEGLSGKERCLKGFVLRTSS